MSTIASQITSLTIVYSTIYSGADQSKHQSSASLAFVWGIHRGPVNSPHKWPVTRKMFPFDDVIMSLMCVTKRMVKHLVGYSFYTLILPQVENAPMIKEPPPKWTIRQSRVKHCDEQDSFYMLTPNGWQASHRANGDQFSIALPWGGGICFFIFSSKIL